MKGRARIAIDDGVAYVAWIEGARVTLRLSGKMRRAIRTGEVPRPVVGGRRVADDGDPDQLGIVRVDGFPAESEAFESRRPVRREQDIRVAQPLLQDGALVGTLEIELTHFAVTMELRIP